MKKFFVLDILPTLSSDLRKFLKKMSTIDDFLHDLENNTYSEEALQQLTDEQIHMLSERMHNVNPDEDELLQRPEQRTVLCYHNWREDQWKKFMLTAASAFMFKVATEFQPDVILDRYRADFAKEREALENDPTVPPEKKQDVEREMRVAYEEKCASATRVAQQIARSFVSQNFHFNPVKHVKSLRSMLKEDPTRESAMAFIKRLRAEAGAGIAETAETAEAAEAVETDNSGDSQTAQASPVVQNMQVSQESLATQYRILNEACQTYEKTINYLQTAQQYQLVETIMAQKTQMETQRDRLGLLVKPVQAADMVDGLSLELCYNVYHNFGRFISANYDTLVEAVKSFYPDRDFLDIGLQLFQTFSTAEEADAFVNEFRARFQSEPIVVKNNGYTLIGPFEQNKAVLKLLGENSQIIDNIMDEKAKERDAIEDMLKHRVATNKEKGIAEAGADAPALAAYRKALGVIGRLKDKPARTDAEEDELKAARAEEKAALELMPVPESAVQVDAFIVDADEEGRQTVKKAVLYTKEDAARPDKAKLQKQRANPPGKHRPGAAKKAGAPKRPRRS